MTESTTCATIAEVEVTTANDIAQSTSHPHDRYIFHIKRFTLIDTAEESEQWTSRARSQWCGCSASSSSPSIAAAASASPMLALRIINKNVVLGQTDARGVKFHATSGWSGVDWGYMCGIEVSLTQNPMLLLEVVCVDETSKGASASAAANGDSNSISSSIHRSNLSIGGSSGGGSANGNHTSCNNNNNSSSSPGSRSSNSSCGGADRASGGKVVGLGVLCTQFILAEERQFARLCVHLFPMSTSMEPNTVHAIAEVEVHSSLSTAEAPERNFMPLEYNYGCVRVSCVDFYYPPSCSTAPGSMSCRTCCAP